MAEEKLSTRDIAGSRTESARDVQDRPDIVQQRSPGAGGLADEASATPLFRPEEAQGYRTRWDAIQTGFVDEPRRAVEEADSLVADVMKRLAEAFAGERSEMESQWDRGDQVSTEDLRVALRRYRTFFQRLLDF